jgi:hypothetical protein
MDKKLLKAVDEYNKKYNNNYELTEFFECDCHGNDDLIEARMWTNKDKNHTFYELDLSFVAHCNDTQYIWYSIRPDDKWYNKLLDKLERFYKRIKWRIRFASEILFKGHIEYRGTWIPARTFKENNESRIELLQGYETTLKLAEWLKIHAEYIKAKYEEQNSKRKLNAK